MRKLGEALVDHLFDILVAIIVSFICSFIAGNTLEKRTIDATSEFLRYQTEIIVVVALLSLTITILLVRWIKTAIRYKVRIKRLEIIFEYKGDRIVVNSNYTIKTYRFRLTQIFTRREWFSEESFNIRVHPKQFKIRKIRSLGNVHEYYVVLPKAISFLSRPIQYRLTFSGSNKLRKFKNFYWYDVISPLDELVFDIRIPEGMCTSDATLKKFLSNEDSAYCKTVLYNSGFRETIKPKLGYSYKLEWEWANEEAQLQKQKPK